jgi:soluble lytic murein transglycosylase-like protein
VSIAAVNGPAAGGEAAPGALAAGERVQHLQTLIAQVERGSAGFAAELDAAQAQTGASATAGAAGGGQATASDGASPMPAGGGGYPAALYSAATYPSATATYPAAVTAYPSATATYPSTTAAAYPGTVTAYPGTVTESSSGAGGGAYAGLIDQAAARNGVEPAVLYGLIQQESGFDPSATSGAGALGLTQLMPSTAASLGVTEPLDPAQSIEGGARFLGQLLRQFGGNVPEALAAYNAGPGAVQQYGGIPPYPETEQYVTKVLANAAAYRQSGAAAAPTGTVATAAAPTVSYAAGGTAA